MSDFENSQNITKERLATMVKTLCDAHNDSQKDIIEPYLFKMYVQEIIEKKEPLRFNKNFPVLQKNIRNTPSYTSMIRDIKKICSSLGIYNEFATEEKDPCQRQFLSVSLFLPKDKTNFQKPLCEDDLNNFEEIKTVVYINTKTGDLIFKNREHANQAHEARAYQINGYPLESESNTVYRNLTDEDFISSK